MSIEFVKALNTLLDNKPIGFIDVGSRGGVHYIIDKFASQVDVLAFEADPDENRRLEVENRFKEKYASVHFEPTGLFNMNGFRDLHILSASTNSSLLAPNSTFTDRYNMDKWHTVSKSSVEIKTLDHLLSNKFAHNPNYGEAIKLDTQGSEYEILQGAAKTLQDKTQFLMIEVSFCELYQGQKLFSDIELFLRKLDFSFYGFDRLYHRSKKTFEKRTHQSKERMIQADAYFFRDVRDRKIVGDINFRAELIQLCFAMAAGYFDYALEICNDLAKNKNDVIEKFIWQEANINIDYVNEEFGKLMVEIERDPGNIVLALGKFIDANSFKNDFFDK